MKIRLVRFCYSGMGSYVKLCTREPIEMKHTTGSFYFDPDGNVCKKCIPSKAVDKAILRCFNVDLRDAPSLEEFLN
jgi:hypothetical protein